MAKCLENVVSTAEAAEILGISAAGMRQKILRGALDKAKYRKTSDGNTYLFDKKYIESLKK